MYLDVLFCHLICYLLFIKDFYLYGDIKKNYSTNNFCMKNKTTGKECDITAIYKVCVQCL